MSSAVLMSLEFRGDPVSASQLKFLLFFKVVCMMISPFGVALFVSQFMFSNFL